MAGSSVPGNQDGILPGSWEAMHEADAGPVTDTTLLCQVGEGKGYLEADQKPPNNLISSLWKALSCYGNEYSININRIRPNRILPH